jgi:hypothetical protein
MDSPVHVESYAEWTNHGPQTLYDNECPCNGNDKQFEYTFLIICRYLKLVKNQKKSEDNFIANRKFTSCYNIKMYRIWENYMLFSFELCGVKTPNDITLSFIHNRTKSK